MASRDQKVLLAALDAQDYRAFLKAVFQAASRDGKINYSALTRKAGFSSRGFISEVVEGRRRLTGKSFPKMLRALSGPSLLKTYFTYLVQLEEPELDLEDLGETELRKRCEELRTKIRGKVTLGETSGMASIVYGSQHILLVYAALSDTEPGTTLDAIVSRSGLEQGLCVQVLRHLLQNKLVVENAGCFQSINPHLIFEGLGEDKGFKASYIETLAELKRKAGARFNARDQLYFQSFFTVDSKRLPELKQRLRDLMTEFIEESGSDNGDCVSRLLVGYYY